MSFKKSNLNTLLEAFFIFIICYYKIIINGGAGMKKIFSIILIISLSLTFLMISIENSAYCKSYYINAYNKYNIEAETGKDINELGKITDNIIAYLKGIGNDELLSPYFNEREVLHMRDVQTLFMYERTVKYIFGIFSIIIMGYFGYKKEDALLGKTMALGLFANHVVLLALFLLIISSDFNKYFTIFHKIFFSNDLWLLNPETDLLIQMLPEQFFFGMAMKIGLSFLIYLSILQIVGIYYIKKGRDKWKK